MPSRDPSRTEKATPKRREKARKEGNVPKSTELNKAISILGGIIALKIFITFLRERLSEVYLYFIKQSFYLKLTQENLYHVFIYSCKQIAIMVLPIMFIILVLSVVSLRVQVGPLWTTKPLIPKLEVFNLINGIKRIFFDTKTLINLLRSALQALFVGIAPYILLKHEFSNNIANLFYASIPQISVYMLQSGYKMVIYALIPMFVIGLADLAYTRWDYEENLKMTKDEVKDERKQAEGDPTIKNQQKKKMLKVMQQRMLQEVPKADVIITNPTHIAVAILYDPTKAPAPIVVAKGANKLAEKIKQIAREHNVPIRENKPLARALYKNVEIGETIPEELYRAVAAVLAQLYKYKQRR
ncbi:MAG: flagellar biosynthesis protein FlhB [Desulfonauticus sp.]|nr:flagellar biosynthesis protein FlhB [Desulfonauticus sp.]